MPEDNVEVIEAIKLVNPSQEDVEGFYNKIEEARKAVEIEKHINERMLAIVGKVDVIYRECYKIDNTHMLYYSYDWTKDKLITFQVQSQVLKTTGKIPGSLPLAAMWDDKELHISMEMMKSDIYDERQQLKKLIEDQKANGTFDYASALQRREKFWAKIKRWFSF